MKFILTERPITFDVEPESAPDFDGFVVQGSIFVHSIPVPSKSAAYNQVHNDVTSAMSYPMTEGDCLFFPDIDIVEHNGVNMIEFQYTLFCEEDSLEKLLTQDDYKYILENGEVRFTPSCVKSYIDHDVDMYISIDADHDNYEFKLLDHIKQTLDDARKSATASISSVYPGAYIGIAIDFYGIIQGDDFSLDDLRLDFDKYGKII